MKRRGLAVFSAALALLAAVASSPAFATTTELPFASIGEVVVDPAHGHVFVSGGSSASSIAVLDFDGHIVTTITAQQGASGMALDEATGTLYVALRNVSAISKINTATLTEISRFTTTGFSAPGWVALAGGRIWFSYNCMDSGGVGSAALNGTDLQTELPSWTSCYRFATTPTDIDMLAGADMGSSSVRLYNVSTGSPVETAYSSGPGGASNIRQLLFTPAGGDLLIASGAPYSVNSFSVPTFTLSGSYATGPYPVAAAVTADGAYVAGGANAHYDDDVFVFDAAAGDVIRRWDFGEGLTLFGGGLAFSPDATRLFALTKNPATGKADFRVLTAPTQPAADTSVALASSASKVRYGNRVTLTARLAGASGVVSFYGTPYLGGRTLLGRVAVNASGYASLSVRPNRKTWYTAEYAGDATHDGSASAEVVVNVIARTTVTLRGHYGRSGAYKLYRLARNPRVRGSVAPNHAGSTLKFIAQRYRLGGWRTEARGTFTITSTGSAYAVLRNTRRGRYRVRVTFAGDSDHLGSTSSWAYLKVTR